MIGKNDFLPFFAKYTEERISTIVIAVATPRIINDENAARPPSAITIGAAIATRIQTTIDVTTWALMSIFNILISLLGAVQV
jgi:hypothetical protein